MRAIGMAERALDLMVERARTREAFGGPLADQGLVRAAIAESRMQIDQARLLVLDTAHADRHRRRQGGARAEVAAIKIVAARAACDVIDRAIQVHGGAGVSQDTPLARFYAGARTLRLVDGPDEVHLRTVAKQELARAARRARRERRHSRARPNVRASHSTAAFGPAARPISPARAVALRPWSPRCSQSPASSPRTTRWAPRPATWSRQPRRLAGDGRRGAGDVGVRGRARRAVARTSCPGWRRSSPPGPSCRSRT